MYNQPEVDCLAWAIYGEYGNGNFKRKEEQGLFIISEAIRIGRPLCKETHARMPRLYNKKKKKWTGGGYKYSWLYDRDKVEGRLYSGDEAERESFDTSNAIADRLAWQAAHGELELNPFNQYITVEMAIRKPPSWMKYYMTSYKIKGAHVQFTCNWHRRSTKMYDKFYKEAIKKHKKLKHK